VRELVPTIADLRHELGDASVEALTARGAAMEPADLARYALAQIELARALA